MGITLGKNGTSYIFSEPVKLLSWNPPTKSGLYAISVYDTNAKPLPYRVIYIGETSDFSDRGFDSHHKRNSWIKTAGGEANLFISTYNTTGLTEQQRRDIESFLIDIYNPACNG